MRVIVLLFVFFSLSLKAQLTVKGLVTDENREPLPYVDIYVKEYKNIGVTTDGQGNFSLKVPENKVHLVFSCMGFSNKIIRINPRTGYLKVRLKEENNELEEVLVVTKPKKRLKKKENPAYRILKEIWKRKKKNGLCVAKSYEYQKHLVTEIGLNNIDTTLLAALQKTRQQVNTPEIPYDENARPYIPFYIEEKFYNIVGNNDLGKEKQQIIAEKQHGLTDDSFLFERLSNIFGNPVDIYQNNILLLRKSFVSPVSTMGFTSYDYVLYDSIQVAGNKQYRIFFFPRENGDLTFEGHLRVADKSFAVTQISMKIHKDININFIRGLTLEKEFEIVNDSIFYPKMNKYKVDFTLVSKNEDNRGVIVQRMERFKNYVLNKEKPIDFYDKKIEKYKPNQFKKSEEFWKLHTDTNVNKDTYKLIRTFKTNKGINRFTTFINAVVTGYVNTFPGVQTGPFWHILEHNEVEGYKIKYPFRTFKTLDDTFRLQGYLAYGTKDKKIKYALKGSYLLSYRPRVSLDISHSNAIEQLGEQLMEGIDLGRNSAFVSQNLFNVGDNYYLSKVIRNQVHLQWRLVENVRLGFRGAYKEITTAAPNKFKIDYLHTDGNIQSKVIDIYSDVYLIFTPGRFVYGYGVQQRFGTNLYPKFVINYRKSYPNVLGSNTNYQKVQMFYNEPIRAGILGILDVTLEVGKTFGKVPITLLSPVTANQRITLRPNTFHLLNYYDFVTDTYAATHFEHHFNGLIFNRVPFLKYLNLRSLITFRGVYGTISDENRAINKSDITYNSPEKIYYEYGVGIENIGYKNFRFLRVDAIWRGDYHKKLLDNDKFTIRISLRPEF